MLEFNNKNDEFDEITERLAATKKRFDRTDADLRDAHERLKSDPSPKTKAALTVAIESHAEAEDAFGEACREFDEYSTDDNLWP
jgi:hypothetical protein